MVAYFSKYILDIVRLSDAASLEMLQWQKAKGKSLSNYTFKPACLTHMCTLPQLIIIKYQYNSSVSQLSVVLVSLSV